ncbi:MAG: Zn-ribbon domain-containing OB-fold protein [Anaerolineae bacterium]|nr:Zn-ribbon domain-containing OB-fold protein [Anaerolineae bacterium]
MRVAQNWRLKAQRYNLTGEICTECGAKIFPPRDACPECARPARTPYTFSGRGEVYSFTTLYDAPAGFQRYAPYTVALVRLDEGPLVTAQLADIDPEEIRIGLPVEMTTRRLSAEGDEGLIQYGYKFRPRFWNQ